MIIIRLVLFLLLNSLAIHAQDTNSTQTKANAQLKNRLALKVEYFGELVLHPGLSVGLDYSIYKNNWLTVHWNADLGSFWHRWNNTSGFAKTSIGTRFALGSAFADVNAGVGYMHSWVAGNMYQRAENGGVEKASNPGTAHFMPNASLLFGFDAERRLHKPWMIHIGPEVYLQSAFNHTFLPHLATKIGFTYKLNPS